jgi:peptidoglycan/LPS O-acetylase OafA/YrhL
MRNRYVDLLRAAAIVRVVLYHTLGLAWLTVVFPAMGLMFSLGGSLMAGSLDRTGNSAVVRRMRRILPPVWLLAAIALVAMAATGGVTVDWKLLFWVVPVWDPPSNDATVNALGMLWYIRTYLWFILLSPVLLPLFRRLPVPALLVPFAGLVALEVSGHFVKGPFTDFLQYLPAWLLGFAHRDGTLRRLSRTLVWGIAGVLGAVGLVWMWTHLGPRGIDLNDIPIADVLISVAFLLVLLSVEPRMASFGPFNAVIEAVNRRVLSVYLWHQSVVLSVTGLLTLGGVIALPLFGPLAKACLVFALVGLVVLAVGWVEDLAARRRPALLPMPVRAPAPVPAPAAAREPVTVAAG